MHFSSLFKKKNIGFTQEYVTVKINLLPDLEYNINNESHYNMFCRKKLLNIIIYILNTCSNNTLREWSDSIKTKHLNTETPFRCQGHSS